MRDCYAVVRSSSIVRLIWIRGCREDIRNVYIGACSRPRRYTGNDGDNVRRPGRHGCAALADAAGAGVPEAAQRASLEAIRADRSVIADLDHPFWVAWASQLVDDAYIIGGRGTVVGDGQGEGDQTPGVDARRRRRLADLQVCAAPNLGDGHGLVTVVGAVIDAHLGGVPDHAAVLTHRVIRCRNGDDQIARFDAKRLCAGEDQRCRTNSAV